MPAPAMVFHHPLPVEGQPRVGSTAHVTRMIEGFTRAGYEVEHVVGYTRERLAAIARVRAQMSAGRRFEFMYAEASTAPTCLNDPHHLPLHPLADWRFFRFVQRHGVPIGLFYPDVHWRFPFYRSTVPLVKRVPAATFYRFDLWWYRGVLDLLFLPSARMKLSVPGWEQSDRVVGLAPGGTTDPLPSTARPGELHLFYVGAITPPLYDISALVAVVKRVAGVFLTICCPPAEAHLVPDGDCDRITVVHEHGDALRARYAACDIACLVYPPEPYREFAMPVKLFEAMGFGRPVLVSTGNTAADFVERTGVGWVVDDRSLQPTLERLVRDVALVDASRAVVLQQQEAHSWESRARFVASSLTLPTGSRPSSITEPASGL